MARQGSLQEVSIKKNLRWFLEQKATGKITLVVGKRGSAPITGVIEFKEGTPIGAQLGAERGQRALGQILNLPSEGTYKIETEEPAAVPSARQLMEEMPTIPGFIAKAPPAPEPEPPVLFEAPAAAEVLPTPEPLPMGETPPPVADILASLKPLPAVEAPPAAPPPPPQSAPAAPGTPSETINEILRGLQRRDSNFQASAVISKDGLIVASILPSGVPQDRVAVSAASIVAQAQSATQDLERGNLQDIFIRGEGGYICVAKIRDAAYLLAITKSAAMLGSILLELKKAGDEIGKIL